MHRRRDLPRSPPVTAEPEGRRLLARRPLSWPGEAPIPPFGILCENLEFSFNTQKSCTILLTRANRMPVERHQKNRWGAGKIIFPASYLLARSEGTLDLQSRIKLADVQLDTERFEPQQGGGLDNREFPAAAILA